MHSIVKGSEIDVEFNDRELGMAHCTTQVGPSDHAMSHVSDAFTCRITGMKDISFQKARSACQTYGRGIKNDLIRSKLTVILGLSIAIVLSMCVGAMSIVDVDVILGSV